MPTRPSPFRRARQVSLRQPFHAVESLEARQHLAADLGVVFDDFDGAPSTLIPGDRVAIPIVVRNVGDTAAVGRVSIDFYLSTNTTLDGNDTLLRTFANQNIQLSADGFPNSEGEFEGTVTIPAITPGNYFFLVRLRPNNAIGDFNQSNNTASSEDAQNFDWRFGTFGGRTNAVMTITDPSGTEVSFGLSGGGSGTVTRDATNSERFDIALSNTGGNSRLSITAEGGEGPTSGLGLIDDITGGTLGAIDAPTARLQGDIGLSGSVGSIRFHSVVGHSAINILGSGINTAYTFGDVTDLVINSASPIASITVESWRDQGGVVDLVTAPWLGDLVAEDDFEAGLRLAGRSGSARTLNSADIGGTFAKGAWDIGGRSGPISIGSGDSDTSISIEKALSGFSVEGNFRGVLAAKTISDVEIGLNLRSARILAGAYLGSDARLGGIAADADTFAVGNISRVHIGRQVLSSIIGAGLDPVDGLFNNGDDRLRGGRITDLVVDRTASANSKFLAKRYSTPISIAGRDIEFLDDRRFALSEGTGPTVATIALDPTDAPTTITITFTDNQRMRLSTLGNGDITVAGPNGFSMTLTFVSASRPNSSSRSATAIYTLTPPGGTWNAADNGEYQIVANANQVRDAAGNALAGGQIGTFSINL